MGASHCAPNGYAIRFAAVPSEITWVMKVRERIGWPKRGAVPELAAKCGVPRRTLAAWMKGTNTATDPTQDGTLARIASALGVSEDWLLDGRPGPPPEPGRGLQIAPEAMRRVPKRFHRLLHSLADVKRLEIYAAYCDFLDSQQPRS